MTRIDGRRLLRAALGVVLLLAVAACSSRLRTRGPLSLSGSLDSQDGSSVSSFAITSPGLIAFGANVMINTGTSPITDISAAVTSQTSKTVVTRQEPALVAELSGDVVALGVGPWPYADLAPHARPASGYQLKPGVRVDLILLVRVLDLGPGGAAAQWASTTVQYRYRGQTFTTSVANGLRICNGGVDACK